MRGLVYLASRSNASNSLSISFNALLSLFSDCSVPLIIILKIAVTKASSFVRRLHLKEVNDNFIEKHRAIHM